MFLDFGIAAGILPAGRALGVQGRANVAVDDRAPKIAPPTHQLTDPLIH